MGTNLSKNQTPSCEYKGNKGQISLNKGFTDCAKIESKKSFKQNFSNKKFRKSFVILITIRKKN